MDKLLIAGGIPLSGEVAISGAKNAALSIMIGGEAPAVDRVRPLLQCMGKTLVHVGTAGAISTTSAPC